MPLLETIHSPDDLKRLPAEQLAPLAAEIRERIIRVTSENGGHIGPNLGVVELTIALHRVFSTPADSFVFDVSHQGYVHKLLTGRNGPEFDKLRQTGGVSGFFNRAESEHDAFGAGHAGTAVSAALGLAAGRDLRGGEGHVVALVGDAALTCGVTLEALNNVAHSARRLIVVLNDNEWAIDRNVGAIADHLNALITSPFYNKANRELRALLEKVPGGARLLEIGRAVKRDTKDFLTARQASLFENFKLRYVGPVDGHDIGQLVRYLEFCRQSDAPVLLHVRTIKGKGCDVALRNPEKFHGCSPFDIETGDAKTTLAAAGTGATGTAAAAAVSVKPPNWQDVFGRVLVRLAQRDKRVLGITAAMPSGTSLNLLKHECPAQYFDVGIAEGHAAVFAAGLAVKGFKPVVAIYSTFLQRAFDMVLHDVCLQNLGVVFCMDRAGLSPADGATHHGLFDITFLRSIPRAIVMQPRDARELAAMLRAALDSGAPAFIRYPRGTAAGGDAFDGSGELPPPVEIGRAEVLRDGADVCFWALGPLCDAALALAERIEKTFPKLRAGVVNARFAKPLDTPLLLEQARKARLVVTLEDNVLAGGFGSAVLETLSDAAVATPVVRVGWPDEFVGHGTTGGELRAAHGLSPDAVFEKIAARLR
ncbi:MAG: 1-deoxy-D-xylulose-5-phosphate synthase [Puniceicoccales bacterium]|jgi:1-deoxy-D-xylulose-5-phosphate synthase|nr:1-deoxy-D-xylulose-5-phosphate synthase [Puniceicoccales bacterium]